MGKNMTAFAYICFEDLILPFRESIKRTKRTAISPAMAGRNSMN